jgi:hypothetical protein
MSGRRVATIFRRQCRDSASQASRESGSLASGASDDLEDVKELLTQREVISLVRRPGGGRRQGVPQQQEMTGAHVPMGNWD